MPPPDPTTDPKPTDAKKPDPKPAEKASTLPKGAIAAKVKARYYAPGRKPEPCTVLAVYESNPSVAARLEVDGEEIADVVEWNGQGMQPGVGCWVRA